MNVPKTIRILAASLALLALVVFATGVVSDWNHHDSTNDAQCPYCHQGHQAPANPEPTQIVSVLQPIASLPVPEDVSLVTIPVLSETSPRAPPAS